MRVGLSGGTAIAEGVMALLRDAVTRARMALAAFDWTAIGRAQAEMGREL